jgi:hypothetical protein
VPLPLPLLLLPVVAVVVAEDVDTLECDDMFVNAGWESKFP